MTGRLRVVETGLASGRWNTALSAALLRAEDVEPGDACLRFYRFHPCVLLGATQPYAEGVAHRHCAAAGIEIARRVTGGGGVYMSPTMLAWDVVMRQAAPAESLSIGISAALADAVRALGFADVTSSATGLALAGRKLSGAAMGSERAMFLYQGTLLIEDEAPAMAAALGLPLHALEPHVTCLRDAGHEIPGSAALQTALASHLARALGMVPETGSLTLHEQAAAVREHAREFGTDAFVRGAEIDGVSQRSARA